MLRLLSLIILFFSLITSVFANNAPFPAQMMFGIQQIPQPLVAENKNYLVYEIYLTSYYPTTATLTSLTVGDANTNAKLFAFENQDLAKLIHTTNSKMKDADPLVFQPGITKMIFMWLPFEKNTQIPTELVHKIVVNAKHDQEDLTWSYTTDPILIAKYPPILIYPPLRGDNWFAGSAPSNTSIHRGANMIINGHDYFAQRYAIDFIQLGADGTSYQGDEHKNSSYFCYGQDVLAVSTGKVVEVTDGLEENIPHSGKLAIPMKLENVPGNHIIIKISDKRFAGFAHLIPGSIKVKVGDTVTRGQVIGKVGNSGNSSEPHLHFQITNQGSFLGSDGVPYAFNYFTLRPSKVIQEDPAHIQYLDGVKTQVYTNQLMLENAVVNFRS